MTDVRIPQRGKQLQFTNQRGIGGAYVVCVSIMLCVILSGQCLAAQPWGTALGSFNGVINYSNSPTTMPSPQPRNNSTGIYTGLEWECVEYVQRYYYMQYRMNLFSLSGGLTAYQFFGNAAKMHLTPYANGGTTAPRPGDILCFSGTGAAQPGHVAIVRSVTATELFLIEQNGTQSSSDANFALNMTTTGGCYSVDASRLWSLLSVQGWLRNPASGIASPPHVNIGSGTGTAIEGALVSLTANSIPQRLISDSNGYWYVPSLPSGTFVYGSISKAGYQCCPFSFTVGSKSLQTGVVVDSLDPIPPVGTPTPSTRFQLNDRVQVTNTVNGLRARYPQVDSAPVAVMDDGEMGTVKGGPVSHNGYQWWCIKYDSLSTIAWSAEGEPATPGVYYLTEVSVVTQPVLNVSPGSQSVGAGAGLAYFYVTNIGTGTMNWSASSNASWLHFVSGTNIGFDSGTIQCTCDANTGTGQRTGTVQVTAAGATSSPQSVTVIQAGTVAAPPVRPDIVVAYGSRIPGGTEVIIGDFNPSTGDGTDFGIAPVGMGVEHVFVIQDIYGDAGSILQLTGSPIVQISGSSDFYIYQQPSLTSLGPADATGFRLDFSPTSAGVKHAVVSIISNDTNSSPYQFAIQGTGAFPSVTVNSAGVSGVPIVVSPPDANGQTNGVSPFSVSYSSGTQITFVTPATVGRYVFTGWSGASFSTSTTATFTIPNPTLSDYSMTANYEERVRTLNVQSTGAAGVSITASPADRSAQNVGPTNFQLNYDNMAYVALTAPSTSGGKPFIDWSGVDGQDGAVGYIRMNSDKTVTANYFDAAALAVTSISPDSGPLTGNTSVTIDGSNFVAPMTVLFNGIAGASVTVLNTRALTAITPAGSFPGAAEVAVSSGTATKTVPGGFAYLGSPYQTRALWPPSAVSPYNFGTWGLTPLGDVDGDGVDDITVTDNNATVSGGVSGSGCVFVYSGKRGSLLFTLRSPIEMPSGLFGTSASAVPDVDGDGIQDIVIGAMFENSGASPQSAGRAHIFSGKTGVFLRTLVSPNEEQSGYFGYSVSSVEDVDGDGKGDVIVGAPYEDRNAAPFNRGYAYVFSGATGACLNTLSSQNPATGGMFGHSVSGTSDMNGDGKWDIFVGTVLSSADPHAYIFSGSNGSVVRSLTFAGRPSSYSFGATVIGIPDVNTDGIPDLLVGDPDGNTQTGQVFVMSGSNGALLRTLVSPSPQSNGGFGCSLCPIADIDGDDVPDIIVGASSENPGASPSLAGRAYVFSGKTGVLVKTLASPAEKSGGQFGRSVAAIGDINGDGINEVAVGTATENRVYIFPMQLDTAPPTGTIFINDNRSVTNSVNATLALTWDDGIFGSGVTRMRFSDDGAHWSSWESLVATRAYPLPSGDGYKTVRVQFLDKANNRSMALSDYIRLDTIPPTGSIIINGGATSTKTQAVSLGLTWADGTGSGVSRMRFSDDGAHWTNWEVPKSPRAYTLPAGVGYHTVRVQYLDAGNNYSPVYNDYIKLIAP